MLQPWDESSVWCYCLSWASAMVWPTNSQNVTPSSKSNHETNNKPQSPPNVSGPVGATIRLDFGPEMTAAGRTGLLRRKGRWTSASLLERKKGVTPRLSVYIQTERSRNAHHSAPPELRFVFRSRAPNLSALLNRTMLTLDRPIFFVVFPSPMGIGLSLSTGPSHRFTLRPDQGNQASETKS